MIQRKNKKAVTAVVATALIIVVAVVSVIGFQSWFGSFSSKTFVNVEQNSDQAAQSSQIETLVGDELYFKNNLEDNLSVKEIKVNGKVCNISITNLSLGVGSISLENCTENLTTNVADVTIITEKKIFNKKIFVKDIDSSGSVVSLNLKYKREITLTENNNTNLDDYSFKIVIDTQSLISGGKLKSDCSDLRVYDDLNNELPYWVEHTSCNNVSTNIWFKTNLGSSTTKKVYLHYGDNGATDNSNGDNVFLLFDDFDGGSLDTNKWEIEAGEEPYFSVNNSELSFKENVIGVYGDVWTKHYYDYDYLAAEQYINITRVSSGGMNAYKVGFRDNITKNVLDGFHLFPEGANNRYICLAGSGCQWSGVPNTGAKIGFTRLTIIKEINKIKAKAEGKTNFDDEWVGVTNNDAKYLRIFRSYTDNDVGLNWFILRKHTPQEPTVSVGAEQVI